MFLTVKNKQEYSKAKSELNQILDFFNKREDTKNFTMLILKGFPVFYKIVNQINNRKKLTIDANIEFTSNIDVRKVKCSCGKEDCKVGLNFDDNAMLLTNKFGNETAMQLDKENIDEIIVWLKQIKKGVK